MRDVRILPLLAAAAALPACMDTPRSEIAGDTPVANSASVMLAGPGGEARGSATLTQTDAGIRLVADGRGLPPGAHGIHLHMVGRCDAPDFATAGSHWNPSSAVHGKDALGGPHWGDLPNLIIGTDGVGRLEVTLPGARLMGGPNPLLDEDGAALVIHAAPDDYRTDPSGNSGGRIACGLVVPG